MGPGGLVSIATGPSRQRLEGARLPDSIAVVNLVAVPLSGTVGPALYGGYKVLRRYGPNDGVVLLAETVWPGGANLVALGSDHFFTALQEDTAGLALLRALDTAVRQHSAWPSWCRASAPAGATAEPPWRLSAASAGENRGREGHVPNAPAAEIEEEARVHGQRVQDAAVLLDHLLQDGPALLDRRVEGDALDAHLFQVDHDGQRRVMAPIRRMDVSPGHREGILLRIVPDFGGGVLVVLDVVDPAAHDHAEGHGGGDSPGAS